jgi:hypothetical protein
MVYVKCVKKFFLLSSPSIFSMWFLACLAGKISKAANVFVLVIIFVCVLDFDNVVAFSAIYT